MTIARADGWPYSRHTLITRVTRTADKLAALAERREQGKTLMWELDEELAVAR